MDKMKKDKNRFSYEFTSSQEQIQKLQGDVASSKPSKHQRSKNIKEISSMNRLSDEESSESEETDNDEEMSDKDGGTHEGNQLKEIELMAKRMAMIEKQNRHMMLLLSQLPGAPTPSIVKHHDGYEHPHLWKRSLKQHCQRN